MRQIDDRETHAAVLVASSDGNSELQHRGQVWHVAGAPGATPSTDGSFPKSIARRGSEVSRDLNLVQEEWQRVAAASGQVRRETQGTRECVCRAQHFWVGNEFPSHSKTARTRCRDVSLVCACRTRCIHATNASLRKWRNGSRAYNGASSLRTSISYSRTTSIPCQSGTAPSGVQRLLLLVAAAPIPQAFLDSNEYVQKKDGGSMMMRQFKSLLQQFFRTRTPPTRGSCGGHLQADPQKHGSGRDR